MLRKIVNVLFLEEGGLLQTYTQQTWEAHIWICYDNENVTQEFYVTKIGSCRFRKSYLIQGYMVVIRN